MVAMVQPMYGEQHQPTMMPNNAGQADSLRQMSAVEADRCIRAGREQRLVAARMTRYFTQRKATARRVQDPRGGRAATPATA